MNQFKQYLRNGPDFVSVLANLKLSFITLSFSLSLPLSLSISHPLSFVIFCSLTNWRFPLLLFFSYLTMSNSRDPLVLFSYLTERKHDHQTLQMSKSKTLLDWFCSLYKEITLFTEIFHPFITVLEAEWHCYYSSLLLTNV